MLCRSNFLLILFSVFLVSCNISKNQISIKGILTEKNINNKFIPFTKGTYESEDLWINLIPLCPEGSVACDHIIYISINKKTGSYIVLKGEGFLDETGNLKGYIFCDKEYKYTIYRDNHLYISKGDKIINKVKLNEIN